MLIIRRVVEAIAEARNLNHGTFSVRNALTEGKPVYLWHTSNGVNYIRYALSLTPTDTKVAFKNNRTVLSKDEEANLMVKVPNDWSFLECEGRYKSGAGGAGIMGLIYLGEEVPARVRIIPTVEKIDD